MKIKKRVRIYSAYAAMVFRYLGFEVVEDRNSFIVSYDVVC